MELPGTSHSKLEKAGTCQKEIQTSGTKKRSLLCGRPNDIDRYSLALDSVNFHLK